MSGLLARLLGRNRGAADPSGLGAPVDESFRLVAENSVDAILRIGPDMRVSYVSAAAKDLLGWSPAELRGKSLSDTIPAEDLGEVAAGLARLLSGTVETAEMTTAFRREDGAVIRVEAKGRLIRDRTGAPGDLVVVIRDLNQQRAFDDRLTESALADSLTGLVNRRGFDQALDREWRRTIRDGGELSLLLLDIDRFKPFNVRYGAQAGDDCLRAVANAVRGALRRAADIAGRHGGDEFAVILPGAGADAAASVAEAIRAAVEALGLAHESNPEGGFRVTVSVGAATAFLSKGGGIAIPQGLAMAAEAAMQKAKQSGRNSVAAGVLLAPDSDEPGGDVAA